MRKALFGVIVTAVVLTTGILLFRNRHQLFRPDVNTKGGTLLVFAVEGNPPDEVFNDALTVLQNRFDPTTGLGIVVRRGENQSIEIAVPKGEKHDEHVDTIKQIIADSGSFELAMLANQHDDELASKEALKIKAVDEGPPPAPKNPQGTSEFTTNLPDRRKYAYRWVRINTRGLQDMQLDITRSRGHDPASLMMLEASATTNSPCSPNSTGGCILLARKVPKMPTLIVYALVREEPPEQRITSRHIDRVRVESNSVIGRHGFEAHSINIGLNPEGVEKLQDFTRHNVSEMYAVARTPHQRRLAVILNDEVEKATVLTAPLRKRLYFGLEDDPQACERMGMLIRGGKLPVIIRSKPLQETTIEPRK